MKRVLMAMSGGLDSSIACILLQDAGYEVVGATFRTWDYISESCLAKNTGCCSMDAIHDAANFTSRHQIPHHIFDFRQEFRNIVIDSFVENYRIGLTPNPCVICNAQIKWGLMIQKADELNCDYIATGHYAGVKKRENQFILTNASDQVKDQTYFLWQLTSSQLSRTLFPLSGMTKDAVRKLAVERGFSALSKKRESQEICFIQDNNYRNFIQKEYPDVYTKSIKGDILDKKGTPIGKHNGYLNYTIGQRKGLGIAMGEPVYITDINPITNTITIGLKDDLLSSSMLVSDFILNGFTEIPNSFEAEVKIRYNTRKVKALITRSSETLRIEFNEAVSAITPGQSAVFYIGEECVGGGIIIKS